jgi:hypothetical protein
MKVVNFEEFRKKKYPQYLTDDELNILRQIDEQRDILFTDEELEQSLLSIPEGKLDE